MRTSISTTSGRAGAALSIAWRPSAASPTTSMSGSASSTMRKPVADERLVVGDQHPDAHRRHRDPRPHDVSRRLGHAARLELAAVEPDALAHPDEPVAGAVAVARPRRRPSSATSSSRPSRLVADGHVRRRQPGVLDALVSASCTIRYAARSMPSRSSRRVAPDRAASTCSPPRASRSTSAPRSSRLALRLELGAPRRRRAAPRASAASRRARSRPVCLDRLERLAGALRVAVEMRPAAAACTTISTDAVGDDVVQLARDPRALLAARRAARCSRSRSSASLRSRRARVARPASHGASPIRPAENTKLRHVDRVGREHARPHPRRRRPASRPSPGGPPCRRRANRTRPRPRRVRRPAADRR